MQEGRILFVYDLCRSGTVCLIMYFYCFKNSQNRTNKIVYLIIYYYI